MAARLLLIASLGVTAVATALLAMSLVLLGRADLLGGAVAAASGLLALAGSTSLVRLSLYADRRRS
jgi:hypothetical protein